MGLEKYLPKTAENIEEFRQKLEDKFKNFKQNIPAAGLTKEELEQMIAPYKVLKRLEEIEQWVNTFADPAIKTNMTSITALYNEITTTISPNITANVQKIEEMFNEIKDGILPQMQGILDLATTAKNAAEETLERATFAANSANKALTDSNLSLDMVTDFFNRFKITGNMLRDDTLRLRYAAEDLINNVKIELNRIAAVFKMLGDNLSASAAIIYNEAKDIGNEIIEAYNEIKIPVNRAKTFFDRVQNPNLFDLALIFYNIFMAFGHLTIFSYGGQDGAFFEVIEGFREISTEFKELGNAFLGFGNRIKQDVPVVYETIESAMENIKIAINQFLDAISIMTTNLSTNLLPSQ